jgi:hypothetical protein
MRMIDELRFYAIEPGKLDEYLEHSHAVALPLRRDGFGKLLGFWYGEVGAAHSIWNLWEHDSFESRQEKRAALQRLPGWTSDYLPHSQPLMREQYVRLLTRTMPIAQPTESCVYEIRCIRTKPGQSGSLASALRDDAPPLMREANVGIWTSTIGIVNEVVQILGHRDIGARMEMSLEHPAMREFMKKHGPLIEEIDSSLVIATPASPMP